MQNAIIKLVSESQLNHNLPNFKSGDTIQVFSKIKEEKKNVFKCLKG